ncbi:MAG: hypothetical protein R2701_04845 [Acidimicrobiales bacterium]|nr:hypothetical protein [Acidimicrobiales bacterium]
MLAPGHLLAHQGGWDEALMVLVPVGAFVGLVWVAYRRSNDDQHENGPTPS